MTVIRPVRLVSEEHNILWSLWCHILHDNIVYSAEIIFWREAFYFCQTASEDHKMS